jgi:hypothetical protein
MRQSIHSDYGQAVIFMRGFSTPSLWTLLTGRIGLDLPLCGHESIGRIPHHTLSAIRLAHNTCGPSARPALASFTIGVPVLHAIGHVNVVVQLEGA